MDSCICSEGIRFLEALAKEGSSSNVERAPLQTAQQPNPQPDLKAQHVTRPFG
jgi:hypothetical protein